MAIELTPAKLAELKKKAEAAADSPWTVDGLEVVRLRPSDFDDPTDEVYQVASCEWICNAKHIAAADPATVLAMVEEIELLKKRLRWFPAHVKEKIDLAILVHTGGKETIDVRKELCMCDHTVGYYCEFCAVLEALISCKKATESEAGQ